MVRFFIAVGSISAFLAVAAGAFAAHALEARLEARWVDVFKTGAHYQLIHAIALLAVAWISTLFPGRAVFIAGWLFLVGTLLFSGSLYLLALTQIRWLGAITPLGGVCFLAGWAFLAVGAITGKG